MNNVREWLTVNKLLNMFRKIMFLFGLDLNSKSAFCHPAKNSFAEVIDAYRQVGLCSVDGTSATNNLSSLRRPLWWTSQSPAFQLSGSVPVDGIRAIDVSRKPARYRSLSSSSVFQTLPSRHSSLRRSLATPWPMPTQLGTGASTATLLRV